MAIKFVLFLLFMTVEAQSQECVQNLPGFADQGGINGERLRSDSQGTQAIIPDYSFDCYGNVTQWGAYVERSFNRYTLDFQVWRRSGGGQGTTGNYDFVGNNRFSSISPAQRSGGQILRDVPVEQQIQVRPGDVIGLYLRGEDSNDDGVELHTNSPDVTVWFTPTTAAVPTRIEVGNTNSIGLHSSTTAAPVITAMVLPSTTSPSPTPSPTSQTLALVQFSAPSIPQSSSFLPSPDTTSPPVGSGLPVGAIVAIVIVVIVLGVLILVFILALALRRRSKKMVDSLDNFEYSELYASVPNEVALEYFEMNTNDAYGTNTADIATTGNVAYTAEIATTENVAYMTAGIATTGNVAYMTAEDTIPATQNVAYGQVPPATDESYEYVRCD